MSSVIVLGAGMVGSAMAIDLASKHAVTLTDIRQDVLDRVRQKCSALQTQVLDVTNRVELQKTIQSFDLVVCAVPGFWALRPSVRSLRRVLLLLTFHFFRKMHWNCMIWR